MSGASLLMGLHTSTVYNDVTFPLLKLLLQPARSAGGGAEVLPVVLVVINGIVLLRSLFHMLIEDNLVLFLEHLDLCCLTMILE